MWIVLKGRIKQPQQTKGQKPNNNNKQENKPAQSKSENEQPSRPRQKQETENTNKVAPQGDKSPINRIIKGKEIFIKIKRDHQDLMQGYKFLVVITF